VGVYIRKYDRDIHKKTRGALGGADRALFVNRFPEDRQ